MVHDTLSGGCLPTLYMPNMKSLSWTTKKLQPGHYLLRMQGSIWPRGQNSRSKVTINGRYATHRLEVVYLHAKYEKPVLNGKKVTARTRFVMDADQFDLEVKGHQQWYATHRLEVFYLHVKYAKPVLNDQKVTARTRFVTDRVITIGRPPQSGMALINNKHLILIRFLYNQIINLI